MLTQSRNPNPSPLPRRSLALWAAALGSLAVTLLAPAKAAAQEPAVCLSSNPSDWPAPSKPYFHIVVDTSGSMTACTTPPTSWPNECNSAAPGYQLNSCGMVPNRINDAKCALRNTVQAFAGEANFGLATFAAALSGCPANCASSCGAPNGENTCTQELYGCTLSTFPGDPGGSLLGCGNNPNCASAGPSSPNWPKGGWRNGANLVVGLQQDPSWPGGSPLPSNVNEILKYFDSSCAENKELFAAGATPLAGSLRATAQYLRAGWSAWTTTNYCQNLSYTFPTPMNAQDRPCRSVNLILVTDGDESCDSQAQAVAAAQDLFTNGVSLGGKTWPVRVYVINFAGGTQTATDQIAAAGGTGSSLFATNEATLSVQLANVIASAVKPEVCDNDDNNCNGCTDEGYKHYCDVNQTCCPWATPGARGTCLANYKASITPANPQGDLTLLPCTSPQQQSEPPNWLCFDPQEKCDDIDNNCNGQVDEGFVKCGNPAKCPTAEICNGVDDNCDGLIDNASGSGVPYSVCPNNCQPSPEVCDGCDNDCDGIADDGIAPVSCGSTAPGCPTNCQGVSSCVSAGVSVPIGGCTTPAGFGTCNQNVQPEVCDGCDNDCDGTADDNVAPTPCTIPGQTGLIYQDQFPFSQCKKGTQPCNGTCSGWVGPSSEVCDGIDNDCDGTVDEGSLPGVGGDCGNGTPPCQKGKFACVGGQLVCQGGSQPQPEVCDGVDNNCNGVVDDQPLADSPANPGCWNVPGNCCTHGNLSWCAPPGGTCNGKGSLAAPCQTGTLQCAGASKWACVGGTLPAPEACDGTDNDCDGTLDENPGPPVGQTCGIDTGECQTGNWVCNQGVLACTEVGPSPEICDGKDNDCDGTVDNGVGLQGPCEPAYDKTLYPGARDKGECKPGQLECDPTCANPQCTKCTGGVGPSPEVCDGKDNDCDGEVDEQGVAPDGIAVGSPNPLDPNQKIGDPCGTDVGECTPGQYVCENGQFICDGSTGPQVESCDCADNDCDGQIDEDPDPNEQPICSTGKTCVAASAGNCQCAPQCSGGEFPCPTGAQCKNVPKSSDPNQTGNYCITDKCGDCSKKTVKSNATGETLCAPEGTATPYTPVCICKGNECRNPCDGIQCPTGQDCVEVGPATGTCKGQDNCYYFGCGDGKVCKNGLCADDPCEPNPCQPDEVCKPNETFTDARCVASCANVSCPAGKKCVEGQCVGCDSDCPAGEVCQLDADAGGSCVTNKCEGDAGVVCTNGAYCDPATGQCGSYPCEGVKCPSAQICVDGECQWAPEGGAGTGGGGGSGGSGGSTTDGGAATGGTSGSGQSGSSGTSSGSEPRGAWGLATGGGGCACTTAGERDRSPHALLLAGVAVGLSLMRRRRRARALETSGGAS